MIPLPSPLGSLINPMFAAYVRIIGLALRWKCRSHNMHLQVASIYFITLLFVFLNTERRNLTDVHQISEVLVVVQSVAHHELI